MGKVKSIKLFFVAAFSHSIEDLFVDERKHDCPEEPLKSSIMLRVPKLYATASRPSATRLRSEYGLLMWHGFEECRGGPLLRTRLP